jgi:hypothetical protein
MKRVRAVHVLLAAGAFIALIAAFFLLPGPSRRTPDWADGGPCTVALTGHAMNVTAVGSGARSACMSWLPRTDAANPGGELQCFCEREGLTITVRDEGDAWYGGNYCTYLEDWSNGGGPIPDVADDSFVPLIPSASPS